ncbi:16464_t:CDS:2, partial [Racocetra persica]
QTRQENEQAKRAQTLTNSEISMNVSKSLPKFGICCKQGKVNLPTLRAKIDYTVLSICSSYCFCIHDELRYFSGSLLSKHVNDAEKFSKFFGTSLFYPKYRQVQKFLSQAHEEGGVSETDLSVYLYFNTTTNR